MALEQVIEGIRAFGLYDTLKNYTFTSERPAFVSALNLRSTFRSAADKDPEINEIAEKIQRLEDQCGYRLVVELNSKLEFKTEDSQYKASLSSCGLEYGRVIQSESIPFIRAVVPQTIDIKLALSWLDQDISKEDIQDYIEAGKAEAYKLIGQVSDALKTNSELRSNNSAIEHNKLQKLEPDDADLYKFRVSVVAEVSGFKVCNCIGQLISTRLLPVEHSLIYANVAVRRNTDGNLFFTVFAGINQLHNSGVLDISGEQKLELLKFPTQLHDALRKNGYPVNSVLQDESQIITDVQTSAGLGSTDRPAFEDLAAILKIIQETSQTLVAIQD